MDIEHQMTTRRKSAGIIRQKLEQVIKPKKRVDPEKAKRKYIHHYFTQEYLLREAAKTEIFNIKSLQDLLHMEEIKKRKKSRKKQPFGPKIIFKDSYKSGKHITYYKFQSTKAKKRIFPLMNLSQNSNFNKNNNQ